MDVTVRAATAADATAVRDVHLASIEGLAGVAYDDEQVAAWAHDRDPAGYPIESADTRFLVAERDGRVVGFGWLKPDADDYFRRDVDGEITAVYVHPTVAGRGVGSRIYGALEIRARREDLGSLGLWASLNAVPFYDAQGFTRVTEHTLAFDDEVEATVVEMQKVLDS